MDKHRLPCLVFPCKFQDNLIRPEFQIPDFICLEIVIHRNAVFALDVGDERNILCTVEDGLDAF